MRGEQDVAKWEKAFKASGMASAKTVGRGRARSVPATHRHDGGGEETAIGERWGPGFKNHRSYRMEWGIFLQE